MSFHKRHISTEQIVDMYRRNGMQAVYEWYTKGVDAIITETGLASDVGDLIGETNDWNRMSELISDYSIKKGFDEKTD
jgi:hypothetical protein|tara:strand:- start:170 stop:403 length:234 start_codon:yes stop_codon:yes gene_type:complete